jgi:hypothetical protein
MSKYYIYFLIILNVVTASAQDLKTNFYGETSLSEGKSSSLSTNLSGEYTLSLYEPIHKRWLLYLAGKISTDYDHLNNEIKTNVFTTIGVDF